MTADLYDISRHQRSIDWAKVPDVPIVHKVNEGRAIDPKVGSRLPIIANPDRADVFGGYTVLIVSSSSIREQIDTYARIMQPWWRDRGAFTQLDVEPWPGRYPRPVNADELDQAVERHAELFGPDRITVYMNPNQMPAVFAEWRRRHPDMPLWLPDYSADGSIQAARRRAIIHQYTDSGRVPGFAELVDLNRIRDRVVFDRITGRTQPAPTQHPLPPEAVPVKPVVVFDSTLKAWFTVDGVPLSPDLLAAYRLQGAIEVSQDHPWWRAAIMHRNGPHAAELYARLNP